MENYAKKLDGILRQMELERQGEKQSGPQSGAKTLLLHSCCAPCSSYVLEYLREYFSVTVFYYNPNITEEAEYRKRVEEEKRLIGEYNRQVETGDFTGMRSGKYARPIKILEGVYEPERFFDLARGLEACPEGGERCFKCYELRLAETARRAKEEGFDCFTTTLTISPLKNAQKLNEIGERLAAQYETAFLPSDFKKKDGYKRSVELSERFGLYRQDYCGCVYSRRQREEKLRGEKYRD